MMTWITTFHLIFTIPFWIHALAGVNKHFISLISFLSTCFGNVLTFESGRSCSKFDWDFMAIWLFFIFIVSLCWWLKLNMDWVISHSLFFNETCKNGMIWSKLWCWWRWNVVYDFTNDVFVDLFFFNGTRFVLGVCLQEWDKEVFHISSRHSEKDCYWILNYIMSFHHFEGFNWRFRGMFIIISTEG